MKNYLFFPMESVLIDSKLISVYVKCFVVPTSGGGLLTSSTVSKWNKKRQSGVNPKVQNNDSFLWH